MLKKREKEKKKCDLQITFSFHLSFFPSFFISILINFSKYNAFLYRLFKAIKHECSSKFYSFHLILKRQTFGNYNIFSSLFTDSFKCVSLFALSSGPKPLTPLCASTESGYKVHSYNLVLATLYCFLSAFVY